MFDIIVHIRLIYYKVINCLCNMSELNSITRNIKEHIYLCLTKALAV